MVFLRIRNALDVDHITAIDNLVRLHNVVKGACWVGSSFSVGHMLAVCLEMIGLRIPETCFRNNHKIRFALSRTVYFKIEDPKPPDRLSMTLRTHNRDHIIVL